MSKLYWANEVAMVLNDKIDSVTKDLLADNSLSDDDLLESIHEVRIFKKFADEIIADLEEADRKDNEEKKRIESNEK